MYKVMLSMLNVNIYWLYAYLLVDKLALREKKEKERKITKMGALFHFKTIEETLGCILTLHGSYSPHQAPSNEPKGA